MCELTRVTLPVYEKMNLIKKHVLGPASEEDCKLFRTRYLIHREEYPYIVTEWLAKRLKKHGEKVLYMRGRNYWIIQYGDHTFYDVRNNNKYERQYILGHALIDIAREEAHY